MSRNLVLLSHDDEFTLVQTPTSITDAAMAVTGNVSSQVVIYERWLRDCRMWEFSWWDDYAPGWSWDRITRHIAQVNAFVAFASGARFAST